MPKYNKVYSSFYNGISQQIPELMHETNCEDMVNCIPDIVNGATKRPPCKFQGSGYHGHDRGMIVHSYDRGEDNEEYLFLTDTMDYSSLEIMDTSGTGYDVNWVGDAEQDYLVTNDHTNIKAVTVQDTTFLINTEKTIGLGVRGEEVNTSTSATITLTDGIIECERVSPPPGWFGNAKYIATYTVTVRVEFDGTLYTQTSEIQSYDGYDSTVNTIAITQSLYISLINSLTGYYAVASGTNKVIVIKDDESAFETYVGGTASPSLSVTEGTISTALNGFSSEDTTSTANTAFYWAKRASGDELHQWRYAVYLDNVKYESVHHESDTAMETLADNINNGGKFTAIRKGSTLKITKNNNTDFSFDSWDSWGDQASFGWKDSVAKLTDLPSDLGWERYVVQIVGTDANDFTDYFVRSTGSAWQETRDPNDTRGQLTNMPLVITRETNGAFYVRQGAWELPNVGSEDTNPTPSFVGTTLTDVFFYKNRLGIASANNLVLSEIGGYYNFYIKSVLSILDTDPIDIAIDSNTSKSIEWVVPFQSSLFIFTQESQHELTYNGTLAPTTVGIDLVSSYPMATKVKPVVSGDSLYFISITRRKQQLRHYKKNNDTLNVVGTDLNLTTPTLLQKEITAILVNEVLGYVVCATSSFEVYLYNYRDNSSERVQSAWSRWEFFQGLDWDNYTHWQDIDTTTVQWTLLGSNLFFTISTTGGGEGGEG